MFMWNKTAVSLTKLAYWFSVIERKEIQNQVKHLTGGDHLVQEFPRISSVSVTVGHTHKHTQLYLAAWPFRNINIKQINVFCMQKWFSFFWPQEYIQVQKTLEHLLWHALSIMSSFEKKPSCWSHVIRLLENECLSVRCFLFHL